MLRYIDAVRVVPWKDSCKLWPDTTAVLLSGQHPCALLLCDGHFRIKVPICYLDFIALPVCSVRVERVEPLGGRLATSR